MVHEKLKPIATKYDYRIEIFHSFLINGWELELYPHGKRSLGDHDIVNVQCVAHILVSKNYLDKTPESQVVVELTKEIEKAFNYV